MLPVVAWNWQSYMALWRISNYAVARTGNSMLLTSVRYLLCQHVQRDDDAEDEQTAAICLFLFTMTDM